MKNILIHIYISALLIFISSCSIQDQLKDDEKLPFQALSMHIQDEEPIIALDTGYFSILASNPTGKITKFSVNHLSEFPGFISKTKIQVSDDITVNEAGELSRPASTILINYPMVGSSVPGEILTAEFTFTDDNGKTATAKASKKVVNFKTNGSQQFLYVTRPLHNFHDGLSYSSAVIDDNLTFKDSLDVFWLRVDGIQYLASPDADVTAAEFASRYSTVVYDQESMRHSKIIKLEGLSLIDVDDDVFASMDFSNGVDVIEVEDGAVYGFLLEDGRKAALEIVIYLTQYSRVRSKVQVSVAD